MCVDSPALRAPPQEGDASGRGGKVKTRIVRDVLTPPPCGHPLKRGTPTGRGGKAKSDCSRWKRKPYLISNQNVIVFD